MTPLAKSRSSLVEPLLIALLVLIGLFGAIGCSGPEAATAESLAQQFQQQQQQQLKQEQSKAALAAVAAAEALATNENTRQIYEAIRRFIWKGESQGGGLGQLREPEAVVRWTSTLLGPCGRASLPWAPKLDSRVKRQSNNNNNNDNSRLKLAESQQEQTLIQLPKQQQQQSPQTDRQKTVPHSTYLRLEVDPNGFVMDRPEQSRRLFKVKQLLESFDLPSSSLDPYYRASRNYLPPGGKLPAAATGEPLNQLARAESNESREIVRRSDPVAQGPHQDGGGVKGDGSKELALIQPAPPMHHRTINDYKRTENSRWNNLRGMWGKRSVNNDDYYLSDGLALAKLIKQQQQEDDRLHLLSE